MWLWRDCCFVRKDGTRNAAGGRNERNPHRLAPLRTAPSSFGGGLFFLTVLCCSASHSGVALQASDGAKRRFKLLLIKPSHYDDDGYVIRWWRALIPSNSLAALYGIAMDCAERQVLG